jgi:hypothetical protein
VEDRLIYRKFLFLTVFLSMLFCFGAFSPVAAEAGSITGTVTDGTNPIQDLAVFVFKIDNEEHSEKGVLTDDSGKYTVENLTAGSYKVWFFTDGTEYIEEWYHRTATVYDFASAETVSVNDTTAIVADAVLSTGTEISGTVTVEGSDGTTGIADVYVVAYDTNGNKAKTSSVTGIDGVYSVGGLLSGSYTVEFSAAHTTYATEWYNNSAANAYTMAAAKPVSVPASATSIDGELDLGGSISGMVTIGRQRIAGALINVYAASGNGPPDRPIGSALTDADGKYTVGGLPLGAYKMQFFEKDGTDSGAVLEEWYSDQTHFANAALVSTGSYAVNVVLGGVNNYPPVLVPVYQLLLKTEPTP